MAITKLIADSITSGAIASTPAFEAYLSSNQTISQSTYTKVQFDTEIFDTDNCYDNSSNYRFTPTTAGKYFCFYQVQSSWTGSSGPWNINSRFVFNGSASSTLGASNFVDFSNTVDMVMSSIQSGIITFNGSSDYLEIQHKSNASTPRIDSKSYFGAYKILT